MTERAEMSLRIAWLGPIPRKNGGVGSVSWQHLVGLARAGVQLDCYVSASESHVDEELRNEPRINFICQPPRFSDRAWYSRTDLGKFVVGQCARAIAQGRLAYSIIRAHRAEPYDCLYQVSQIELFAVRLLRRRMPPLVLHPHTYARGEVRWLLRELPIADRCTPKVKNRLVIAVQLARAFVQRRDVHLARALIVPSRLFAALLAEDYRYPLERIFIAPNPIDLDAMRPAKDAVAHEPPLKLLVVSRIVARKGLELVVELSHRLADLEGQVTIEVVGDRSLWTDYTSLLNDLNTSTASYVGGVSHTKLNETYQQADLFLAPSRFEPFGLTVGEALATGLPVIASDAVGATEDVDCAACLRFADGDIDDLIRAVREMVERVKSTRSAELRREARAEAERLFAPNISAHALRRALDAAIAGPRP